MNLVYHLAIYFSIYVIVALSLNLIVGYCGRLSLATAAFFAVGGYSYALLTLQAHWGLASVLLASMSLSALLSLAMSLPSGRIKGDQFVLVSLAVQAVVASLLRNLSSTHAPLGSLQNLTNGPTGIAGIPAPVVFGWQVKQFQDYVLFAAGVSLICALVLFRLKSSAWGRVLQCTRDDELAARSLGKNTQFLRVQALAFSAAFTAVAGILYAGHVRYIDPTAASLDESILALSMIIVGGTGNVRGPIAGALLLVVFPEILRYLHLPETQAGNIRLGVYGILLVLLMHFRPEGIAGQYRAR